MYIVLRKSCQIKCITRYIFNFLDSDDKKIKNDIKINKNDDNRNMDIQL